MQWKRNRDEVKFSEHLVDIYQAVDLSQAQIGPFEVKFLEGHFIAISARTFGGEL